MHTISLNQVLNHVVVCIIYVVLWIPAWLFSVNLETISGVVSWFLPAGIRLSFLLFLPKKYWPVIFIGELISANYIQLQVAVVPFENLFHVVVHNSLMIFAYMFCAWQYLKHHKSFSIDRVDELLGLFRWVLLTLIISAILFNLNLASVGQPLLPEILERSLAFVLGDLVGIIAIVIPVTLIKKLVDDQVDTRQLMQVLLTVCLIITLYLTSYLVGKEVAIHAKVLALLLFIIIAYYFHSLGAGFSVLAITAIFLIGIYLGIDIGNPIDNQLFLIATTLASLLIGAAIGEQKKLTSKLQQSNLDLSEANQQERKLTTELEHNNRALNSINEQLLSTVGSNKELAKKLVTLQETERTQIARELHDEVGQNITAIKVNLAVTKSSTNDQEVIKLLSETESIADCMYSSTHQLINYLHPRVIDELGLEKALSQTVIGQVLDKAHIEYVCLVSGNLDKLDDNHAIAIYRIAQEAINNTIKHADASRLTLELDVSEQLINFTISDNGKGFNPKASASGMGLVNIKDRVSAIGGSYKLSSDINGTQHKITFVLI